MWEKESMNSSKWNAKECLEFVREAGFVNIDIQSETINVYTVLEFSTSENIQLLYTEIDVANWIQ